MPAKGIHHVDLAVTDVARSMEFYLALLGPLGWFEYARFDTYRKTEEVIYLKDPVSGANLGLRPADGGAHEYYNVGIEHLAFEVDSREEVEAAHERCVARGDRIDFPPEVDSDIPEYYATFVFDPDGMRIEVFCWPRTD